MSFIIALIAGIAVVVFASFNNSDVTINFIFAKYELSLTIVILIAATIGAFAMYIINLFKTFKLKKKIKQLSAKLTELGVDVSMIIGKSAKQLKAERKAEQKAIKQAEKESKKQAKQQAKAEAKQKSAVIEPAVTEPAKPQPAVEPAVKTTPVVTEPATEVKPAKVEKTINDVVSEQPTKVESKPVDNDKFSGEV